MYYVLKFFAWLVSRSPYIFLEKSAYFLAWLSFNVLKIRRKTILKNLEIAFGGRFTPKERLHLGETSTRNFFLTVFEFLRSHYRAGELEIEFDESVSYLQEALAKNHGVFILCGHLGNWEAFGAEVSKRVCPAHVFVKKVGGKGVSRFVEETRKRAGFLSIDRRSKLDGIKAIHKNLAKKEIVGFVLDQSRPGEPRLPFFAQNARTNTSLAAIWQRHPVPIIPGYIQRTGRGKHRIYFLKELDMQSFNAAEQKNRQEDILTHSTYFNRVIAEMIERNPGEYFWLHNRWK